MKLVAHLFRLAPPLSLALAACFSGCDSSDDSAKKPDPCANAGCALAPFCGSPCGAACGCCDCNEGATFQLSSGSYVCNGGCLAKLTPDGGTDAGSDAGIDCSRVGCAPPPFCDSGCTAPCGCCSCSEGQVQGGFVCSGGCFAPISDAATEAATDAGGD